METELEKMIANYQTVKKDLRFFDANCWLDLADTEKFHQIGSLEQLSSYLAGKGIARAVITDSDSTRYDPYIGNERLEALLSSSGNLYGSLVLTPDILYNGLNLYKYIHQKISRRFVTARFFPKRYYHSLADFVMGDVWSCLQNIRLPVMLWHGETSWEEIDSLCARYPELPLIIEGNPTKLLYHNRNYMALLNSHKNLYLETHGLIQFMELDSLVASFGAGRLIYGSYAPYNDPDVTLANICLAQMSPEAKRQIAGGNLETLIEGIKSPV
ncbi:MAG TPA: hypothetical protein DD640_10355 [Clostridiales bacterium]|nr:hypothetical protein [Clostridiales bacterium]